MFCVPLCLFCGALWVRSGSPDPGPWTPDPERLTWALPHGSQCTSSPPLFQVTPAAVSPSCRGVSRLIVLFGPLGFHVATAFANPLPTFLGQSVFLQVYETFVP